MQSYIQKVSAGENLTLQEAEKAITEIFTQATDAQYWIAHGFEMKVRLLMR
jgi:anthranilate phosphoribosyltransferase